MWSAMDIAIVLAAIGVLIPIVGNFILAIATFIRAGQTHELVNGLSERKDEAVKAAAKAEGKIEGKAEGEQAIATAIDLAKAAIAGPPQTK